MRVDLAHEEFIILNRTFQEHPLIPTWRYIELKFPKLQMMKDDGDMPITHTRFRLSLDLAEDSGTVAMFQNYLKQKNIFAVCCDNQPLLQEVLWQCQL
jgi:hypothetical protein